MERKWKPRSPGGEGRMEAGNVKGKIEIQHPNGWLSMSVAFHCSTPCHSALFKTPGSRLWEWRRPPRRRRRGICTAKRTRQCFIQLEIRGVGHPIPLVRWNAPKQMPKLLGSRGEVALILKDPFGAFVVSTLSVFRTSSFFSFLVPCIFNSADGE